MSLSDTNNDSLIWVPMCCERVMRHNVFGQMGKSSVATFVCTSCGKHIALQPAISEVIEEYGQGAHVLRVLGVHRPTERTWPTTPDEDSEQTL